MQNTNYGSNYNSGNNQGNGANYPNANSGNNQNNAPNYNSNNNINNTPKKKKNKKNTVMIVVISILSVVAIAMACVLSFLFADIFNKNESSEEEKKTEQTTPAEPVKKSDVKDKRYVNSDSYLELYDGPGTEYIVNIEIPVGEELTITEYTDNGFAKTTYDNQEGYVKTEFLSETKPEMWEYDETEVEEFAKDVLYGYVDSINEGDFGILSKYLTGTAKDEARSNYDAIKKVVESEEIKEVECYDVQRLSKNSVTVMRDSIITIYKKNGEVKEVHETYLTTVENTSGGMKATKFESRDFSEEIIEEATLIVDESEEEYEEAESSPSEISDESSSDTYEGGYWYYTESEIYDVVEGSLEWYVNAVNTGNAEGAEDYFKGQILTTEKANAQKMANTVAGETLIDVRCHSYKRLSDTRVSVVRESDIQIVEKSGSSRIATESRVYVMENTGNGVYIVDMHK